MCVCGWGGKTGWSGSFSEMSGLGNWADVLLLVKLWMAGRTKMRTTVDKC